MKQAGRLWAAGAVCAATVALNAAAAAQTPQTPQSPQAPQGGPPGVPSPAYTVDVIGATPLPGVGLLLEEIPAPVRTAVSRDIEDSGALDLSDFLNRRLTGVHVNEIQGNPYQADVSYRGYTASPLLGTPQGLSVYMDGVRLNQPFGDVVSWDLIPRLAISSTTLMPGSNPLFGLNTLGGALSVQTKDGRSHSGTSLQAMYGSHTRRAIEFEHGGTSGRGDWYLAGNLFGEDGWRESSPSEVRQVFGKLGWKGAGEVKLALGYADNTLNGNGLQETRLLDGDRASIYTKPDITDNRSAFVNLGTRHSISPSRIVVANAYYRDIRTKTLNADINEASLDQSIYQLSAADRAALAAAGYSGFPTGPSSASDTPFPSWPCIAQALQNDEPGEKCDALLNRTSSVQHNYGGSAQMTRFGTTAGGGRSQFTVGVAYDRSTVGFQQATEFGYLNPDRSATGVNAFADGGLTGGTVDGVPFDTRVNLDGLIQTWSLYATDTEALGKSWHLTMSARYNRTSVGNTDRLQPDPGPGSLTADASFARLNPAVGLTFTPTRSTNAYVGYSEGSRAPTSIELGCADPVQPCKLPNAMTGDPPLDQVVARTLEAGVRGGQGRRVSWAFGVFRAANRNDILFVASTQTGFGYFRNFGTTRRQGIELSLDSHLQRVTVGAAYTFLDATYESAETVNGTGNSTNDAAALGSKGLEGTIAIQPGDRMPLIPRHMLKAFADVPLGSKVAIDLDVVAASSSYARGNENNAHQADGVYYLGPGTSPSYAVANLGARYQMMRKLQLVAQINNLFNGRYETAAQLGPTGLTAAGTVLARPFPPVGGEFPLKQSTFYAPGAPRLFWAALRLKF